MTSDEKAIVRSYLINSLTPEDPKAANNDLKVTPDQKSAVSICFHYFYDTLLADPSITNVWSKLVCASGQPHAGEPFCTRMNSAIRNAFDSLNKNTKVSPAVESQTGTAVKD
jgi:hypothetical protein